MFRTYEPTRDRLVAVKVFRLDIVPEQAQSLADELSRAAEAGLFHPSIVEPIAAGMEGTLAYRAEEYVAAESLDVAMRHYAPAPIETALPFITQLAGAIDFARAAGVGHGGLHPRDILVTPDEARATGFGVVEALERAGVRAPVRRPYTAPERIERTDWSTPADVFSLAAIAFELLTARRPAGTGKQIGALNGDRPDGIHAVLARAMDDDPAKRYPSALAFAAALESAARAGYAPGSRVESPVAVAAPVVLATATAPAAPSLLDAAEPAAMVSLDTPVRIGAPATVEEPLEMKESADDEVAAQTSDAESRRPLEAVYETSAEPEPYRADDVAYSANEPPYGAEPELRDAPERSRPAILPIAVTLVLGLLAGFAAGYFVGNRDSAPSTATAVPAGRPAEPAGTPATNPSARQYSEQAVTPPAQPSAPPPVEPPPVVSEETAPRPGRPAPAAGASAPSTRAATAASGRLLVRSTPARASVTVNGKWIGRTPLTMEKLPFGHYVVRVVEPGYRVEHNEFALNARDSTRSINVRLVPARPPTPARPPAVTPPSSRAARPETSTPPAVDGAFTGALYVDSRPQGANVLLDGRIVGKTPLRLSDVRIGTHVVRIELPEHRPWSSVARITAGQESRVTGSLERFQ